ncbi:MAG TPA: DUF2207 domain-containing protein, partial [Actinomycetota bacterium]|nr:DUF2207 domain-containing protein [Actinomycetota bacterium]
MRAALDQTGEVWQLAGLEQGTEDFPIDPVPTDYQYTFGHAVEVNSVVRRLASVLLVAVSLLGFGSGTAAAQEKSFSLPNADVVVRVQESGALRITEHLTYSFNGSFSGGYREIPLREGETITDV